MASANLLAAIQAAVRANQHRFTVHAISRAGVHGILLGQLEEALPCSQAEVIEDYLDDPRGSSCLVYGRTDSGDVLHVVCSYPPRVAVITCYRPDLATWESDFKTRSRRTV